MIELVQLHFAGRFVGRLLGIVVVVGTLLIGAPAMADETDPEKAKEHFSRGSSLYAEGEYSEALTEFELGHAAYPNAVFQYNMALCHWRLGDFDRAIDEAEAARDGLAESDDAKAVALNESRLAAFELAVTTKDLAAGMEPVPEVVIVDAPPVEKSSNMSVLGSVGIGLGVIGAGGLVWWFFLDAELGEKIDRYEAAAQASDEETWSQLRTEIESDQTTAQLLLFGGAGAFALGTTLLIVDLLPSEESVALVPTLGGLRAVGRFY